MNLLSFRVKLKMNFFCCFFLFSMLLSLFKMYELFWLIVEIRGCWVNYSLVYIKFSQDTVLKPFKFFFFKWNVYKLILPQTLLQYKLHCLPLVDSSISQSISQDTVLKPFKFFFKSVWNVYKLILPQTDSSISQSNSQAPQSFQSNHQRLLVLY